jgi:hypothetical protein
VAGYLNQYASDSDPQVIPILDLVHALADDPTQTFFSKYRTGAVGTTFTHVQVNGGKNDQAKPGGEGV